MTLPTLSTVCAALLLVATLLSPAHPLSSEPKVSAATSGDCDAAEHLHKQADGHTYEEPAQRVKESQDSNHGHHHERSGEGEYYNRHGEGGHGHGHGHEHGHSQSHSQGEPAQRVKASQDQHNHHDEGDHGHEHEHEHEHHGEDEHEHHHHHHRRRHHHHHHHHHGEDEHDRDHDHHDHEDTNEIDMNPWGYAVLATMLISSASLVTIPFLSVLSQPRALKIGMAFAVGGLLGDVFLHIVPHEMGGGHDHGHAHSHGGESHGHSHGWEELKPGALIILGIVIFLAIDKLMRGMMRSSGHGHSHARAHSHGKSEKGKHVESSDHAVTKSTAILNLVADATHNFTDGLAIGVSFGRGQNQVATTLAVLLHELPHEVGDVAILIAAGYRPTQAVKMQFMTAIGAMTGTLVGLLSGSYFKGLADVIGLITAGGFVYVALVTVLPSLLEEPELWQSVWELLAIAAGVALMAMVCYFE